MGRLSRSRSAGVGLIIAAIGSASLSAGTATGQALPTSAIAPGVQRVAPASTTAPGGIVFDAPAARGDLGEDVVFETTLRGGEPPHRVELVRGVPGDRVMMVSLAAVTPAGPGAWRARVVQTGHVAPNTLYRYHFRALTADGRRVAGPEGSHRVRDVRFEWRRSAGDGVTVWWYEGDEAFARRALGVAEQAIESAAELLGVEDVRPVDFFIYADDRAFRQAMGPATRENVGGEAHPDIDTLFGLIGPRQVDSAWVGELVVHELAHLVFDEATRNAYGYPPRWLNEGLAVYLSRGLDDGDRDQVAAAARSGAIIPLEGLVGQFPTRPGRSGLAYAESVSAVDHFIERHGEAALRVLVSELARSGSLDEAFRAATGAGIDAFEDAWLEEIGGERPEPYGPRRAPSAVVPTEGTSEGAPPRGALLR